MSRYVTFCISFIEQNERVIYLPKHDTFKVVDKRSLKGVDAKSQKPCPPDLATKLEVALEAQPEPEQPTAQEIANNNFTGLAPAPKSQSGSEIGSKPESQP
ncbi:MAG: hypothetical protein F6K48_29280 [Okeania sp. SIO3H1]|nr:hypothetical protein [Okeania sp. SIO3H1]